MALSNQKLIFFENKFVKDLFSNSDKLIDFFFFFIKNYISSNYE